MPMLANSPLCLLQRLRVLMKGTLVEDINYLHRVENMFDFLLPPQRRKSQALQMLGENLAFQDRLWTVLDTDPIPPGSSRKVLCPLLSGLLSPSQPHWIPLKMAPLTVELEINPLVEQYLDSRGDNTSSKLWSLGDAQIKVDLREVDAFLADRVYQMIRSSGLQLHQLDYEVQLFL